MSENKPNKNEIRAVDNLLTQLTISTQIRFVGSNLYMPYEGWENITNEFAEQLFSVLKDSNTEKRFESIVEGEKLIIEQLKNLPSKYAWGLSFEEAINFLNANKISWEVVCEEEAAKV